MLRIEKVMIMAMMLIIHCYHAMMILVIRQKIKFCLEINQAGLTPSFLLPPHALVKSSCKNLNLNREPLEKHQRVDTFSSACCFLKPSWDRTVLTLEMRLLSCRV